MNGSGENQLGTRARKASLLDAKTHLRIGTWNVRTMFDTCTSRTTQERVSTLHKEEDDVGGIERSWNGVVSSSE